MRERVGFIAAVERNELTFSEICERFEISRKTGYKWRGSFACQISYPWKRVTTSY